MREGKLRIIMQAEMSKMSPEQRVAMASLNEEAKKRLAEIAAWDDHEGVKENEMDEIEIVAATPTEEADVVDTPFTDVTLPGVKAEVAASEVAAIVETVRYTQETLAHEFGRIFRNEIMALRNAGQKEYAHDDSSPFANFERGAEDAGLDRKQVLWIYAMKHKDGIASYLKGHTSQREDVRGRINDLIVYLLLLYGMVNEELGIKGTRGLGELSE